MSYVLKQNGIEVIKTLNWNPRTFAKYTNTSFRDKEPEQTWTWEHLNFWLGWIPDVIPEPVSETSKQTIARLENALDEHMDSVAVSYHYKHIERMAGYRGDPNPQFNAEGWAAFNWRSAVYTRGIELIDEVMNGERPLPTEQELIDLMPKITDYLVYPV